MKNKRGLWRWYTGAGLFAAAAALQAAARKISGFGEWYAAHIYPWFVGVIGRISGTFPFSVVEIIGYTLILWAVWGIYFCIRKGSRKVWMDAAAQVFLITGILAFLYTAACGVNYYRRPFSSYLDLEVRDSSVEELRELCIYLTEKVNETAALCGDTELSYNEQAEEGRLAMRRLGEIYPQLAGYYPRPKGLLLSRILSIQQLSGIYMPFTVEANYNREMTDYNIPHTICHELSHLRGFMREDEANFIGYLACIASECVEFRYSGYLTGWIYAGNALAGKDMETYVQLYRSLDEQVLRDLTENSAFWNRFEGPVAETASQMNDAYLKINDQDDGVDSYGRMVDLMLAYYRE